MNIQPKIEAIAKVAVWFLIIAIIMSLVYITAETRSHFR